MLLFINDYQAATGHRICPSCGGFREKYETFKTKTMSTTSKYRIKPMYNGIQLEFGSSVHVFNQTITDAQAEALLKKHPLGKGLFEVLPDEAPIMEPKPKKTAKSTQEKAQ